MYLTSRLRRNRWKKDSSAPEMEGAKLFAMAHREDAFVEVINSLFQIDSNTMKWHVLKPVISNRMMKRLHKRIVGSTEIQV